MIARGAQALLSVGGAWGTLSEVALARAMGVPVASVGAPPMVKLPVPVFDRPEAAVAWALELAAGLP